MPFLANLHSRIQKNNLLRTQRPQKMLFQLWHMSIKTTQIFSLILNTLKYVVRKKLHLKKLYSMLKTFAKQ
jgi:hypothetical protein